MKYTLKSVRALAATLITFGSLAGGANAAIFSVSLNDFDGYQISGTVDSATDVFTITSWSESGGFAGWLPENASLPIILSARTQIGLFDVPDDWGGTIDNSWGFISDLSNNALVWSDGDYTETKRHFGWGAGISSTGSILTSSSEDTLRWSPTGATTINTYTFDEVSVTSIPEPSSSFLLWVGALGLAMARRRRTS